MPNYNGPLVKTECENFIVNQDIPERLRFVSYPEPRPAPLRTMPAAREAGCLDRLGLAGTMVSVKERCFLL